MAAVRERYRQCFAIAERLIGKRFGFYQPPGGFFLWLDVGDGEVAARKLWAEAGTTRAARRLYGAARCGGRQSGPALYPRGAGP